MASVVKELDHGELKCDPNVLYLEIELDQTSSLETLLIQARDIISTRLCALRPSQSE